LTEVFFNYIKILYDCAWLLERKFFRIKRKGETKMIKDRLLATLLVLSVTACFVFITSGCAKKPSVTTAGMEEEVVVVEEVEEIEEDVTVAEEYTEEVLADHHTVKKGECLWWIAEYEDIYADPFMWPLIYDANKDQIKNPNLIYPDQKLTIPRSGLTVEDIKESRRRAGSPRPYTPQADALLPL
jgi:hypothetical protein